MNKRINSVLEAIQHQLEQEGGDDTTYGPGVSAEVGGASTKDTEAGSGGAINPSDVNDTLDIYVTEIADLIALEYDQTPEQALKFVFNAASSLAREGLVPEMPNDDAPPEEVAMWLGKAKSIQFSNQVLTRARQMLAK